MSAGGLKIIVTLLFIINKYQIAVHQFWLTHWQTDAISDSPTSDHVRHFAATSFSLLQQLCTVSHGIFLYGWCEHLFVSELNNAYLTSQYFKAICWVAKSYTAVCFNYFLNMAIFLKIDISQGSVATCLRRGGILKYDLITNLLQSLTVKEFWNSVNKRRFLGLGLDTK